MRYAPLHLALLAQVRWQWRWDWEAILILPLLIFFLGLGVWGVAWVRRWRQTSESAPSVQEELAAHRRLLEQGLLTQEEFDRVRAQLESSAPEGTPPHTPPRK